MQFLFAPVSHNSATLLCSYFISFLQVPFLYILHFILFILILNLFFVFYILFFFFFPILPLFPFLLYSFSSFSLVVCILFFLLTFNFRPLLPTASSRVKVRISSHHPLFVVTNQPKTNSHKTLHKVHPSLPLGFFYSILGPFVIYCSSFYYISILFLFFFRSPFLSGVCPLAVDPDGGEFRRD